MYATPELKYKNRAERMQKLLQLNAPKVVVATEAFLLLSAIYEPENSVWQEGADRAIEAFKRWRDELEQH